MPDIYLIVDPRGKPYKAVSSVSDPQEVCDRLNQGLRDRIEDIVGVYYHVAMVEVIE